jgi:hypothetical protein
MTLAHIRFMHGTVDEEANSGTGMTLIRDCRYRAMSYRRGRHVHEAGANPLAFTPANDAAQPIDAPFSPEQANQEADERQGGQYYHSESGRPDTGKGDEKQRPKPQTQQPAPAPINDRLNHPVR